MRSTGVGQERWGPLASENESEVVMRKKASAI